MTKASTVIPDKSRERATRSGVHAATCSLRDGPRLARYALGRGDNASYRNLTKTIDECARKTGLPVTGRRK
jgi:hypothetical protein